MGLNDVPSAGDTMMVVSDEKTAREAAAKRSTKRRDVRMATTTGGAKVSLETFMMMPADGGTKTLNLILKADGQGSVEALRARVESLSNGEVDVRVILAGVGGITENDVNLASASGAVLIGFNIRPDESVKRLAESEQVDLRFYQVIYDVENDLKKAMVGMLAPKFREIVLGRAEVREIFKVSKVGLDRGLLRAVRQDHPQLQGSRAAGLGGRVRRRDRVAAAVQGRRPGSCRELRVRYPGGSVRRPQAGRRHRGLDLRARGSGVAAGVVAGMVAGVRGGHVASPGTPAISHPWEIAARTQFALAHPWLREFL